MFVRIEAWVEGTGDMLMNDLLLFSGVVATHGDAQVTSVASTHIQISIDANLKEE
jgi:hypothetical protein